MESEKSFIFPEQQVTYATFGQRLGAVLIDYCILFLPALVFQAAHVPFLGLLSGWLYFALMESGAKQATVGKQALGLIVTSERGERISFMNATGRYFGKIVSALILLIGYFMCLFDDRNQTLHDKMAGTLVIKVN